VNFDWITNEFYLRYFWEGFQNTILLMVLSGTLGFAGAVAVALALVTGPWPLAALARGFTTVIRGTPLLVQLFFFYDGVGRLLPAIPGVRETVFWPILREAFFYGVLAFTISVAAYTGEVLRGAMQSVPRGELAAARAFGLSRWKVLTRIWLPRAIQISLPTLTGEVILLLKSVPLVSTIAVMDLLKAANIVRDETFLVYEPLLLVAGIYLAMTMALVAVMRVVETRFPGARPSAEPRLWAALRR
jgi:polar amino acid transport system permease protein